MDKDCQKNEKTGFLVMRIRRGDTIYVGDTIISVREMQGSNAKLAIRADKSVNIKKIEQIKE